jgi:two-component system, NarL family, sensor histidine kinase UhpB
MYPAEELILIAPSRSQLFRILQEAITNVARHAGAQLIEISLGATSEALTLQVQDDGRGIRSKKLQACNR